MVSIEFENRDPSRFLAVLQGMRAQLKELRPTVVNTRRAELDDDLLVTDWIIAQKDATSLAERFLTAHVPGEAYRVATHRMKLRVPHG